MRWEGREWLLFLQRVVTSTACQEALAKGDSMKQLSTTPPPRPNYAPGETEVSSDL